MSTACLELTLCTSGSSGTFDTPKLAAFGSLAVLTLHFSVVPLAPTISIAIFVTRIVAKSRILTFSHRFADFRALFIHRVEKVALLAGIFGTSTVANREGTTSSFV